MKNYIIRIYRCEKDKPKSFVGVVEEVGNTRKEVFKNIDELWDILIRSEKIPPHREGGGQ